MGDKTHIEWTEATWNPVAAFLKEDVEYLGRKFAKGTRGWFCTKVSPGCAHCYAEGINVRLGNSLQYLPINLDKIEFRLVNLDQPLRWKRPRMIFVNSMTDLFHEAIPDALIDVAPQKSLRGSPGRETHLGAEGRCKEMTATFSLPNSSFHFAS